jgi:hypothetical protein
LESPFERRRLLFLNGLFLGFAKVGGRAWLRGPEARELAIDMGHSNIHFKLDKAGGDREGRRRSSAASSAAGAMFLSVADNDTLPGVTVRWQDEEGKPLEKQLTEIIIGMAVAGEHLHRKWVAQQAAWEKQRREQEAREAEQRRKEAERRERERVAAIEKARRAGLIHEAESWQKAKLIRAYVEARLAAATAADSTELQAWSTWALAESDKLDPLSRATDRPPAEEQI